MYLCIFEDDHVGHFLPLVHTKPVYDLRIGRRTALETIREGFGDAELVLHARSTVAQITALRHRVPVNVVPEGADVLFVNGRFIAEEGPLMARFRSAGRLGESRCWVQDDIVVAAWVRHVCSDMLYQEALTAASFVGTVEQVTGACLVQRIWHLVGQLTQAINRDVAVLAQSPVQGQRTKGLLHPAVVVFGDAPVIAGPGARILPGAFLNAEEGPIYIGREAVVHEHAVIQGPASIGSRTIVKAGARIESSAIGPGCKVGGEVSHSIIEAWSNKAHDGYLGHAYLGSWCNIGAGTNNSNLKNDYGSVSLYNEYLEGYEDTREQFVGLIMADHSKCGISTMFNTGTVVGVSCNIWGSGYQPRYIPSFSWSDGPRLVEYRLEKALRVAEAVMKRRDVIFSQTDRDLLAEVSRRTQGVPSRATPPALALSGVA